MVPKETGPSDAAPSTASNFVELEFFFREIMLTCLKVLRASRRYKYGRQGFSLLLRAVSFAVHGMRHNVWSMLNLCVFLGPVSVPVDAHRLRKTFYVLPVKFMWGLYKINEASLFLIDLKGGYSEGFRKEVLSVSLGSVMISCALTVFLIVEHLSACNKPNVSETLHFSFR